MKIATWNVNSLKVRLPHVLDWLAANQPDVLCLQETKLQDENFPIAEIAASGYQTIYTGQRTYNGVAVLSKQPGIEPVMGIPGLDDPQKRVLSAIYDDVRVICIYVPNGEKVGSEKYVYKLRWLAALKELDPGHACPASEAGAAGGFQYCAGRARRARPVIVGRPGSIQPAGA